LLALAAVDFGEALLVALQVFFFVIWIWILITILSDVFRDHELSGWGKAAWVFFLVVVPFLAALIYLIARGGGMRDRTIRAQAEARQHMDAYIRETAATSSADELQKLHDLREKGALTEEEYERAKSRLLS
jgi:Short C-terminal domain/Phospholipase_D-nuclease N-terminal